MRGLAVDAQGKLSVPELSMPRYGSCQALVKMLSCGVCNGTDAKIIHRSFKNFSSYPALLGHEAVGRVVEVGADATKYKPGDIVLLPFLNEPQDGYFPGWGGYCEYAVVGDEAAFARAGKGPGTREFDEGCLAQTVLRDTDNIDPVSASMIVTFREVLSAIRRFGFRPNESVLIYGAGPVGLCFTRFCKLLGLDPVITVDINDEKAAAAKAAGADAALNSRDQDVQAYIRDRFPEGVDNIVDAVGINALINEAMSMVKYNGRICAYGISPQLGMPLDWSAAPYNWSLNFVQWPSKREEAEAHSQIMAWINAGVLDPKPFISHVIPFHDILSAFALLDRREDGLKKIVIAYE